MVDAALFSSASEEWATPPEVFDWLDSHFHFDLDVCATPDNTTCNQYFTKKENGLTSDWGKHRCWMNPPYGRVIIDWMKKACESSNQASVVVCLVPARTDTKWFHQYAGAADEIWFIRGRLKFGDAKNSAPFPSCVVVFHGDAVASTRPKVKLVRVGDVISK